MGNNCRGVGSDAFICTEECSCVHPIIIVTQQTLANVGTAEQPSSSQSPEMQEYLEPTASFSNVRDICHCIISVPKKRD